MSGELPAALTSRKNALNLIFGGDVTRVNFHLMAKLDMICLTLNALQLSINILVYAVINPSFMPEFFACLRGATDFCCKILWPTSLLNCSRCFCYKTHNTRTQAENGLAQHGCEHATVDARIDCEYETPHVEARKSVSASANGNWDTVPEATNGMLGFDLYRYWRNSVTTPRTPNRYRFSSEHGVHKHEQVWSTDLAWKRSSSFGEYAFDNLALEIGAASGKAAHSCSEEYVKTDKKAPDGNTEITAMQTTTT